MTTYKKLNDVITAKHEYFQESDTLLLYNNKPVFFGLEDSDKKYEGNLTQTTYTISSDCDGCYAITIDGEPGTSGTALRVLFYVSKNDSENERTITYKYNNIPLFKILQSGYKYVYFNKVDITSIFTNNPVYMIIIDDKFTTSLPAINQPDVDSASLYIEYEAPTYFYYSLTNQQYELSINYNKFTYISGGGDILGDNISSNIFIKIPEMIAKYDSTTQKITSIIFSNYKTQIKYIGLFIKSNAATSFELQALIDFTRSSKYKVE